RRQEFELLSSSRGSDVPFILDEGTCPYDRVIDAALQRLKHENFGQVVEPDTTMTSARPSVTSSATSSVPKRPPPVRRSTQESTPPPPPPPVEDVTMMTPPPPPLPVEDVRLPPPPSLPV
ncbi:hypothetical protein FOZ63_016363, partial [Perkinsus olseni]